MKRLFVIRHGKAEPHGMTTDFDRTLTPRGLSDAHQLGVQTQSIHSNGSPIMVSAAKRTRQTAEEIARAWGTSTDHIEFLQEGYLASDRAWLTWINAWSDDHDTGWIVGHNPGVSDLAGRLTDQTLWLPTCGMAEIELHAESWASVFAGMGRLRSLSTPKSILTS